MKFTTKPLSILSVPTALLLLYATPVQADNPESEIRETLLEQMELTLTPLQGDALDQVLGKSVWEMEATLLPQPSSGMRAASNQSDKVYYADGEVKAITVPTSNQSMAFLVDLIDPEFSLTDETAPLLQETLKALMPRRFFDSIDPDIVQDDGETWIFYTGTFFDDLKGFVVKVNEQGHIQTVDYHLRLEDNR